MDWSPAETFRHLASLAEANLLEVPAGAWLSHAVANGLVAYEARSRRGFSSGFRLGTFKPDQPTNWNAAQFFVDGTFFTYPGGASVVFDRTSDFIDVNPVRLAGPNSAWVSSSVDEVHRRSQRFVESLLAERVKLRALDR